MKHPFITIIGNVGAGKSTFARFLAKELPAHLVAADEFYKTNPFFHDALVDRSRWSLASDIWFLLRRIEMARGLEKILTRKAVVQDSGLLMTWVYANSRLKVKHMNQHETDLYNKLFDKFTMTTIPEDLVIYLHLPIPLLKERIVKRGRTFEMKYHSEEYLQGLQYSLDTLLAKLARRQIKVVEYEERNWPDITDKKSNTALFVTEIKRHLKGYAL